jgi:hypothetical protein
MKTKTVISRQEPRHMECGPGSRWEKPQPVELPFAIAPMPSKGHTVTMVGHPRLQGQVVEVRHTIDPKLGGVNANHIIEIILE